MSTVSVTTHDGIAVIQIDNPPVNALSPGIPEGLRRAIDIADADATATAIVILGKGSTFVAGADITTLEQAAWGDPSALPDLHDLLARIEDATKPIVMAIHGTALGGGLELAMAGHYRVAVRDALLGQPEVNLGIIPGAEGTQRLPRLVGIERALELTVTGKPIKAPLALEAGLIDAIVEGDLRVGAVQFARTVVTRPAFAQGDGEAGLVRTRDRAERLGTPHDNATHFAAARQLAGAVKRRQTAPLRAIEAIEAAATLPFDEGCRREREIFTECVRSEQAKALIHLFFAERSVAKIPGLGRDVAPRPITRVAIVGAGTMGGGIAMACSNAGLAVRIMDATPAALATGLDHIRHNYETSIKRGRSTTAQVEERLARVTGQLDYTGFDEADVIIEAVFESLELKRRIFSELDQVARPTAVLGTNTSTLDIDAIASATSRPGDVIGLHFFSPANVMRLLEIVRGQQTAPTTIATAFGLAKRLGKIGVLAGNCPGFIGNRMMFPYMYETQFMVEEGATPAQVDRALTDFGMAMGMFAVDDMAGIDVAWRVRQELKHFTTPGERRPRVADRLYELGRLGQKAGRGWYRYDAARKAEPDQEVIDLIRAEAARAGVPQRTLTDEEIVERSVFALINEGARVLDEGFALRASDIDVAYVNGYGFPGWRGGPMFYADRVGLTHVLSRIRAYEAEHGARWAPAPLLARLAETGGTFRSLDRSRA